MVTAVLTGDTARTLRTLDRVALGAILLTPLLLLHAHGIAEGATAVADVCFLARCVITREWAWLRTPWLRAGFAWWGWVTLCSLPIPALDLGEAGLPSLVQGVLIGRFLILIAAMEHAILRDPAPRRWLGWVVTASAIYMLNDLLDLESDRRHPVKRRRPFAAGTLPIWQGFAASFTLLITAGALSLAATPREILPVRWAGTQRMSWKRWRGQG